MDLRQLEYFEAVLETGTFTAAAARCHVAQPALWAQVRALEQEWELSLFERVGRRVRPTSLALALRPLVRVVLGDADRVKGEVQRLRTGEAGLVRLGAPPYQVKYFLAEAIGRYARRYPQSALPLIVPISTADPYAALAEGRVDLVSGARPKEHGFQSLPLYRVWLAAVGPAAKHRTMDVGELRGVPLAALTRQSASRVLLESACTRAGFEPDIRFEDVHADSLLALAGQGLATAVVVNEALSTETSLPISRLRQNRRALEIELFLLWRSDDTLSPAARRVRDAIAELAAERRSAGRLSGTRADEQQASRGDAGHRPRARRVR